MNASPFLHVAVGLVFNHEQKILTALRPAHKHQGNLWEFPGGKIETGETILQGLTRELFEEIGIQVLHAQPFTECHYNYGSQNVFLNVWEVQQFSGTPHGREGQQIAWVSLDELGKLPVLSANHPIVNALIALRTRVE